MATTTQTNATNVRTDEPKHTPAEEQKTQEREYRFETGACTAQGRRSYQEDRMLHVVLKDSRGRRFWVWIVLDGHGGQWTVVFLQQHFLKRLSSHITAAADKGGDMKAALVDAFHEMDADLLREMPEKDQSGSTCTLLLIDEHARRYYVANLGDSRTMFICKQGHAHPLTKDHDRNNRDERARCIAAGAFVQGYYFKVECKAPNPRYGIDAGEEELIDGVTSIMVSRSFGDRLWKQKKVMLATPEVTERMLTSDVMYFVLCTDGVSSDFFMSWDSVAKQVLSGRLRRRVYYSSDDDDDDDDDDEKEHIETKTKSESQTVPSGTMTPKERAELLVKAALQSYNSSDNASAYVIQVHSPPSPWTKSGLNPCLLTCCKGAFRPNPHVCLEPFNEEEEQEGVSSDEAPASAASSVSVDEQPLQQDDQHEEEEDSEEEEDLDEYDSLMEQQWKARLAQLNRRAKHQRKSCKSHRVQRGYRSPTSRPPSATTIRSPVPRTTTRSPTFTRCSM